MDKERRKIKTERDVNRKRYVKLKRVSLGLCGGCGENTICKERSKSYCEKCLDIFRARNKKKYDEDPKRFHKYVRKWCKNNPGKISLHQKRYSESHKNKIKIKNHNRRDRLRFVEGNFTEKEWVSLCSEHSYKCLWCSKETELTVDHVIPITRGGTGYIENIQPLCFNCNAKKGVRIIDFRPFGNIILEWT